MEGDNNLTSLMSLFIEKIRGIRIESIIVSNNHLELWLIIRKDQYYLFFCRYSGTDKRLISNSFYLI